MWCIIVRASVSIGMNGMFYCAISNPVETYDFYEFTYVCYAEMFLLCLS